MSRAFRTERNGQYEALADPSQPLRLVILGSSRAHAGINPRYLETFDESVYNLAMNSNSPLFYLEWYRKLCRGHLKRKLETVLFCVDWNMFFPNRRTFEQDSEYWPRSFFLKTLLFDAEASKRALLMNRFASVKHRADVLYRMIKFRTQDTTVPEESYRGFTPLVENETITAIQTSEADRDRTGSRVDDDPKQRRAFIDLMDEFQKDGVKVILVGLPDYFPEMAEYMKDMKDAYASIRKFSDERGMLFLDYNGGRTTPISYWRQLYYNRTHLNKQGSILFTRVLWDELKNYLPSKGRVQSACDEALWTGDCKSIMGDNQEAIRYYLNAARADPTRYEPHDRLGVIYFDKRQDAEALAEFTKVTELDPNNAHGLMCLANVLAKRQKYSEAVTCFEKAIRLDPHLDIAYYGLGQVFLVQGKPQQAAEYFGKAVSLKPYNDYYVALASAYLEAKEYAHAMRIYLNMMNFTQLDFNSYIGLGTAYFELEKYAAALSAFSKAAEINPADPVPYEHAATIYQKMGHPEYEQQMRNKVRELRGNP